MIHVFLKRLKRTYSPPNLTSGSNMRCLTSTQSVLLCKCHAATILSFKFLATSSAARGSSTPFPTDIDGDLASRPSTTHSRKWYTGHSTPNAWTEDAAAANYKPCSRTKVFIQRQSTKRKDPSAGSKWNCCCCCWDIQWDGKVGDEDVLELGMSCWGRRRGYPEKCTVYSD